MTRSPIITERIRHTTRHYGTHNVNLDQTGEYSRRHQKMAKPAETYHKLGFLTEFDRLSKKMLVSPTRYRSPLSRFGTFRLSFRNFNVDTEIRRQRGLFRFFSSGSHALTPPPSLPPLARFFSGKIRISACLPQPNYECFTAVCSR